MTPWKAGAIVFGASGVVLMLEVLAGRLMAPYVGVSQETFTGIIGTVLSVGMFGCCGFYVLAIAATGP